LQQGLGLLFLKYGRDDENQADELGVEYSLRAGYDASVGCHFFEVLDRQTKESGDALPSWLSTHPAPADRVEHTRALAAQKKAEHPGATRVAEAELKGHVNGIVFGDDPRGGYLDGNTFKHPELGFAIDMPSGWAVQNSPSAVLSAPEDRKAMLQMVLGKSDGAAPEAYAARVAQSAKGSIAQGRAEKINGAPGWIGVLRVPTEQGGQTEVIAGFVQRPAGMFQIVGQGQPLSSYQDTIVKTIRSLRDIDPADKNAQPERVTLETIRSPTTLADAVQRAGSLPIPVAKIALLNNLQPESQLASGFQLKLVRRTGKTAAKGS
jgi:predicted Zn-dependent protease